MPTKPKTETLSLAKAVKVRGYQVRKLPLGKYLEAIELLRDVPGDLLTACFPGQSPEQILRMLKEFTGSDLQAVIGNLMIAAPRQVVRIVARLTEIDETALLDDPNVSLEGIVAIVEAWIEVNDIGNFIRAVRALITQARAAVQSSPQPSIGSSGSSPSASASASASGSFLRTIFPTKSGR